MILATNTPHFYNDLCDEIRLFFDDKKIDLTESLPEEYAGYAIMHRLESAGPSITSMAVLYKDGERLHIHAETAQTGGFRDRLDEKKHLKRIAKISVYRLCKEHFNSPKPWGSLTGIRPSKLARELIHEYGGTEPAKEAFAGVFDVTPEKTGLAFDIAANQKEILESTTEGDTDIYIGIPFCASRCHYCSFASNDISRCGGLVETYLERLFYEIERVFAETRPKVRALYIGGGTPTALAEYDLSRLLEFVSRHIPAPLEYTVEAGRPDTLTEGKLRIVKNAGAERISINPQTLNDETLGRIGRSHTAAEFFGAFEMARKLGFERINTDIIAGLPGETRKDMAHTLAGILRLQPENVTVHTLAIKRASRLREEEGYNLPAAEEAAAMIDLCSRELFHARYRPYYMYRQKYMAGNLENTGYALEGTACVYNVDIMEETASIMAFGAGAISKKVVISENRIERAPNVADLMHYLDRTEEMALRKIRLFSPDA